VSLDTIANETGIDRSKVCRCIRWLETKGVIEVVRRGGGAGLANAYRVIRDAEAAQPPPRETAQPTAAENSAIFGTETIAENSAVFGTETTAENSADCGTVSDENSAVSGTPIEENIEERTPPSGESRAREGESFSQTDWVDKKQRVRLRSIDGGPDRRLAALKAYNPSAATIEFAAELGVNARDPHVLGKFIDYHCSKGNPPADCDAAYRYWISNEWRFAGGHNVRGSPKQSGHSRFVEGIRNRARTRGYDG
jgi:hypothetical protein